MRTLIHPHIDAVELTQVLYALSDPVRLEIVRQLSCEGEATCAALSLDRPKSSMSHHFRVLRETGLMRVRADGTTYINGLRREELDRRFPGLIAAVLTKG